MTRAEAVELGLDLARHARASYDLRRGLAYAELGILVLTAAEELP